MADNRINTYRQLQLKKIEENKEKRQEKEKHLLDEKKNYKPERQ
jgi:hypothetical protein